MAIEYLLAPVNTVLYVAGMDERLSAKDWLDQGLKTLTKSGFTALKADPLAKAMGVSRGSFYWHFADVDAFHTALLKHWREVAVEQIITDIESTPDHGDALIRLLKRVFGFKPQTEMAMRGWAMHNPAVRKALSAIDVRRMSYVQSLLEISGLSPQTASARTQVLYWAFIGFALAEKPLSPVQQEAVIAELIGIALRPQ